MSSCFCPIPSNVESIFWRLAVWSALPCKLSYLFIWQGTHDNGYTSEFRLLHHGVFWKRSCSCVAIQNLPPSFGTLKCHCSLSRTFSWLKSCRPLELHGQHPWNHNLFLKIWKHNPVLLRVFPVQWHCGRTVNQHLKWMWVLLFAYQIAAHSIYAIARASLIVW